jgi:hypothetical protein
MRGVAYGVTSGAVATFVAAGDGGALYSGTVYTVPNPVTIVDTGITWTPLTTTPSTTVTLNAVSYDAYGTRYFVAGNGGAILQSTDAVTWTPQTSITTKTSSDLYAIANNGANTIVATGAAGTIITSLDGGASWTAQTISGSPSPALNGVAFGYVTSLGAYRFMAVGTSGTVLLSVDGVTWTSATSSLPSPITSSVVKGVAYGLVGGYGTFVVVTVGGYATMTSDGGSTWTTPVQVSTSADLNAVTASLNAAVPLSTTVTTTTNAFVAVDAAGNIYRYSSPDVGTSWTWTKVFTDSGSTALYAVTHGGLYDYVTVGSGGVNLYAD